ncbi:ABC-F family ATP-binding cassette domain-containing protein [Rosettibacter firmus]|uniref:ABC-F family ATP-binding cassette domain-containing protein n=1 Tax=Rosettibacter firmus TaxID=3111522 RepID=UPI00336BCE5C
MIDIKNLSIQFTGENLFENVNLKIGKHDKIALVGSNGKGKSTFLKLIYGLEKPESGEIIKQKGIRIGYLPQDLISFHSKTLFDEVKSSIIELKSINEKEKDILSALNSNNISEDDRIELIETLGELHYQKENLDFYNVESKIKKILIGLGFEEKDFGRLTDEFSGGWQMRIQLAKILLGDNDVILLDEPTNHLDIDTLTWLEDFLINYKGALIIVSHDRDFINKVTSKTLEIFNKQINFFPGTYDQYLSFKKEREIKLRAIEKNREKKIKEIEKFIERFRYKATKARQVQSRIKQINKLETIEILEEEKKIEIKFPEPPKSGAIPLELINVSKCYNNNEVLKDINIKIERGEKIAIVGPNGAGKTTLAKIIGNKIDITSGKVIYGYNTLISYYEQEVADSLNPDLDLIDTLEEINDELTPGQIRNLLGAFLFSGDDVFKKVKVLSGGEKSRIALARLLLTKSNLIILDEPTNHLDYNSKEILQKALVDFTGTLIIVSHDIDFLKPIVNKVYEIRNHKLKVYYGGIEYYLQKRNEESEIENSESPQITNKASRKEQKRIEAELRQKKYNNTKDLRKQLELCESEIIKLENLKTQLENDLTKYEIFSNPTLAKEKNNEYEKIKILLNNEYKRWEDLNNLLEEIEKQFRI